MFLANIAPTIVSNMTQMIDYPISITDDKGYIVGSTDDKRLKTFHKPSLDVITINDTLSFYDDQVIHMDNVLPGVATPILLNKNPIGVLGIIGKPEEVGQLILPIKNYVELFCLDSFEKEINRLGDQSVITLVKYLFSPNPSINFDRIIQLGDLMGYNLESNRIVVLYHINEVTEGLNNGLNDRSKGFFRDGLNNISGDLKCYCKDSSQDILAILNPHQFVVLMAVSEKENESRLLCRIRMKTDSLKHYLQKKYQLSASVAVGSIQDMQHIALSYQDALEAIKVGERSHLPSGFYYYNDLTINIESLVTNLTSSKKERLRAVIQDLYSDSHFDVLAQTFIAYCQCNMNLSETSRKLFLHRNSLVYRLNKISRLTSLDVSNFEHCFFLYFAVKNVLNEK